MLLKATEELRGRLGKLKNMYGSGIKALDGIAGDLEGNSQSTFCHLNSEVSSHSSALEDVSISLVFFSLHCSFTLSVLNFVHMI